MTLMVKVRYKKVGQRARKAIHAPWWLQPIACPAPSTGSVKKLTGVKS